jgi:hypothetical protein
MWLPEMLTADDGWRSESATPGKLRFHRAAHFGEQDGNVLDFETSAYTPAERTSFSVAESLCPLNIITGTDIARFRTCAASKPFITGIERFSRIKSGCNS